MDKFKDISGKKFGSLVAISRLPNKKTNAVWLCRCDCGQEIPVFLSNLSRGHTQSCGCTKKERISIKNSTHGLSKTSAEYNSWLSMKSRCYNPNNQDYHLYGGRGISVCDRWLNSFENFLSDMGAKPSSKHSLERKMVNEIYGPENCIWGTVKEQSRNKRNTVYVWYKMELIPLTTACENANINYGQVRQTKYRNKISHQDAFNRYLPKTTLIPHSFGHIV